MFFHSNAFSHKRNASRLQVKLHVVTIKVDFSNPSFKRYTETVLDKNRKQTLRMNM